MRHEETELQRELKRMHGGESGNLNIGLSPTPASLLLSPLLAHMTARHPQVRVSVELGATDALLALLRAERIDALVCDARLLHDAPDIDAQPLAPLRAGLVCRAGHPILAHRRVGVAQIRQYPVASTSLSPEVSLRLAETLGPGGAPEQMVTVRCENLEALTRLALDSDALLLGVISVTRREQEAGLLREVPIARTASGAATMRWRAWPAARRRRCWMRSMPTRGSAGPTSRPTRNDRVEKTDRVHARG